MKESALYPQDKWLVESVEPMNNDNDTLRPEYPEDLIKSGIRGKYTKQYQEGTNVVLIDPDLHKIFPDSDSVNRALREYVANKQSAA